MWLSVRMHLPADMAIVGRDRDQAELAAAGWRFYRLLP
jgi:hypothetical protein